MIYYQVPIFICGKWKKCTSISIFIYTAGSGLFMAVKINAKLVDCWLNYE